MTTRCRQNWSENCEKALNIQINKEYQASLNYHHLSSYFGRDDIGLDKSQFSISKLVRDTDFKVSRDFKEIVKELKNYLFKKG